MFGNSKLAITLVAMSVGTMAATTAEAVLITVNGTTVFNDGFEGTAVGGDSDPNPTLPGPGTWSTSETGGSIVEVTNSGTPGPAFGNNYLRLDRLTDPANASVTAQFSSSAANGDTVHAEWYTWITDAADFSAAFLLGNSSAYGVSIATSPNPKAGSPGTFRPLWYTTNGYDLTDLAFTPGTWQKWEIDWVVGSGQATFTVNGTSQLRGSLADSGMTGVDRMLFAMGSDRENFIDGTAIPEPTSMALVVSAGLLALRRRRA